jgi:hypothetical protein
MAPNVAPLIDSVRIDTTLFWTFRDSYTAYAQSFDSVLVRLYARDANGDSIIVAVEAQNGELLQGAHQFVYLYINDGGNYRDGQTIDTLHFKVSDTANARSELQFELVVGEPNVVPQIQAVLLGDTLFDSLAATLLYEATAGDSLQIVVDAVDENARDSVLELTLHSSEKIALSAAQRLEGWYVCGDSLYRDSLRIVVSDERSADTQWVVIDVNYRRLTLDSITLNSRGDSSIDTTVWTFTDSTPYFELSGADSLLLDPVFTSSTDSTTVNWDALGGTLFTSGDNGAVYVAADSTYMDTLSITLTDERQTTVTAELFISVVPDLEEIRAVE